MALRDEEEGLPVDAAEAECMAAALMAEIGTEPFDDAEVAPDDIDPEDDRRRAARHRGVTTSRRTRSSTAGRSASTGGGHQRVGTEEFDLGEDGASCIADGLEEDDLLRDLLRPVVTEDSDDPDEATLTALLELVETCGGPRWSTRSRATWRRAAS